VGITAKEWIMLGVIAVLGHLMALLWHHAKKHDLALCRRAIYEIGPGDKQVRRELLNSLHTPLHALMLGACLAFGWFGNTSIASFFISVAATTVWAEIWHYGSHRAFHWELLHWIHAEHHKSMISSPVTAISFAFSEKLIFNLGMLAPFVIADRFVSVNFFGIATWYVGYLIVNSFSHANFEFRSPTHNERVGKVIASTTYHSLHHSRYTGNYGLGTRVLDRLFKTEWEDYEAVYLRVNEERKPLTKLREIVSDRATS
jgi:lathosterol oxidase